MKQYYFPGDPERRAQTLLQAIWRGMVARCHDPHNKAYPQYGAKGIFVCLRWRLSFDDFCSDMGPRPTHYEIDRYPDNDGPYIPTNCRWATRSEQGLNRGDFNTRIEFLGRRLTVDEWAIETKLSRETIRSRLRSGWAVERALTEPIKRPYTGGGQGGRFISYHGKSQNLAAWAAQKSIPPRTLSYRLQQGWSVQKALNTPIRTLP
jgi:hypothetical protein